MRKTVPENYLYYLTHPSNPIGPPPGLTLRSSYTRLNRPFSAFLPRFSLLPVLIPCFRLSPGFYRGGILPETAFINTAATLPKPKRGAARGRLSGFIRVRPFLPGPGLPSLNAVSDAFPFLRPAGSTERGRGGPETALTGAASLLQKAKDRGNASRMPSVLHLPGFAPGLGLPLVSAASGRVGGGLCRTPDKRHLRAAEQRGGALRLDGVVLLAGTVKGCNAALRWRSSG
jgi:hypothetical protein